MNGHNLVPHSWVSALMNPPDRSTDWFLGVNLVPMRAAEESDSHPTIDNDMSLTDQAWRQEGMMAGVYGQVHGVAICSDQRWQCIHTERLQRERRERR